MKHSTYPLILQIVIAMLFVRFVRVEAFTKVPRVPCMQSSPLAAPSLAERIVVRDDKPPTLVKVVAHLPLLASVLVARTRELWREAREGGAGVHREHRAPEGPGYRQQRPGGVAGQPQRGAGRGGVERTVAGLGPAGDLHARVWLSQRKV